MGIITVCSHKVAVRINTLYVKIQVCSWHVASVIQEFVIIEFFTLAVLKYN